MARFKNGPIQKRPNFENGPIQLKMVIFTRKYWKKFIVRGSLTFKNILNLYIQHFISDLARRKKKDSVETLNELEGDFSAALFHRGRIILSWRI